ncbi:hypothetical protein [Sinorhizobium arboris]|uniref:hypothetical protein n=1 Tax=Sinorhizobium arboris TaxID=76745 RepID=UPI000421AF9A|nr:hypothetical protein [Sinorhizobium arboris]
MTRRRSAGISRQKPAGTLAVAPLDVAEAFGPAEGRSREIPDLLLMVLRPSDNPVRIFYEQSTYHPGKKVIKIVEI